MITRRLLPSPPLLVISLLLRCVLFLRSPSPAHCARSSGGGGGAAAAGSGGGTYGGRHSYSLSTFSPSGGIDQVVRATRASMLGTPIVAVSVPCWPGPGADDDDDEDGEEEEGGEGSPSSPSSGGSGGTRRRRRRRPVPPGGGIYASMPLRYLSSSPLVIDDGTPRVALVTSSICVIHSGVGADGRALCDAAVSMACEHETTYGEEITAEELLRGLSERVREMTMGAGSRPYGCALLVGCLGDDGDAGGGGGPTMYRVDPSGVVVLLNPPVVVAGGGGGVVGSGRGAGGPSAAFLGNWGDDAPHRRRTTMDDARRTLEDRRYSTEGDVRDALMNVAKRTFVVGDDDDGSSSSSSSSSSSLSSTTGDDDDGGGEEENSLDYSTTGGSSIGSSRTAKRPMLYASFTRERGLRVSRIMG